jgi:leucyl aminopeptidase
VSFPPTAPRFQARASLSEVEASLLAIPVRPEDDRSRVSALAREVEGLLGLDLSDELAVEKASGRPGEIVEFAVAASGSTIERLLLVGIGSGTPADLRKAGAALGRRVRGGSETLATGLAFGANATALRAHLLAIALATYTWSERGVGTSTAPVSGVEVLMRKASDAAVLEEAIAYADAVFLARDLIHTPAAVKSPQWIADRATELAKSSTDLKIRIRDEDALMAEGFGGLIGVGMSSPDRAPRLVEISYAPRGSSDWPHIVIAGKGIVFDTGGISLKRPYDTMAPMKTDMAGAAAVLATIAALPALRRLGIAPQVRVTGLLALAENALSAYSQRPSDVIAQYGGTTVEVLNTDAEGRLVLADALAYADAQLDPDVMVDIATLTGAASLGLGKQYAAMYSRSDALAKALSVAGEKSGDRVWRMPLVDDYAPALHSEIADLSHIDHKSGFSGGSVTAALFLEKFAGARDWVHLDIAGTARSDSDSGENPKGGTGFGVRLLLDWLRAF